MANKPKPDKKVDVTIVVSGQPERLEVNHHQSVEHLVEKALKRSGNAGQAPGEWELRREDGTLIDQSLRVDQAGIVDGTTLFLNPKTGAGGCGRPRHS